MNRKQTHTTETKRKQELHKGHKQTGKKREDLEGFKEWRER